ncbi:hypothetical protein [Halobaculum sp. EA56]
MTGTEYRCTSCGVGMVEPDPPRTDLCPVCRRGDDGGDRPAIADVRGDY